MCDNIGGKNGIPGKIRTCDPLIRSLSFTGMKYDRLTLYAVIMPELLFSFCMFCDIFTCIYKMIKFNCFKYECKKT